MNVFRIKKFEFYFKFNDILAIKLLAGPNGKGLKHSPVDNGRF